MEKRSDDRKIGSPTVGPDPDEARRKEAWKNKNGPVIVVAIAVALVALVSVAMKTRG